MSRRVVRLQRDGAVMAGDSVLVALQIEERVAAAVVGRRMIRLQRDRLVIARDRVRRPPQGAQGIALVVVGSDVARIEQQDLAEQGNGTREVARLGGR